MAQSKSAASKKSTKSSARRTFTLEEAGRALTYVQRVVADLVKAHETAAAAQSAMSETNGAEKNRGQAAVDRAEERLHELAIELAATGVELKDPATGLIDFPGTHHGKPVYLCWRLGEEKIGYFHAIDAGFQGRRPVAELVEAKSGK